MTVTALAPLPTLEVERPTLEVEDSPSSDDPGTVTYAVDDGTVTVTAPALPSPTNDVAPPPEPVGVDELPVASAVDVASTVLVPALEVCPGTSPNTLTTLLFAKQPI